MKLKRPDLDDMDMCSRETMDIFLKVVTMELPSRRQIGRPKKKINGCRERGYNNSWCDKGRCRGQNDR